jgi:uncharacterized membrane protein (TIGR02234 family)
MKSVVNPARIKHLITLIAFSLFQLMVLAQDNNGGSSTTTTTSTKISVSESENWYASPWVWVAGAAVFILLLVALLRGNSNSRAASDTARTDKVTITKQVRTERDTNTDVV